MLPFIFYCIKTFVLAMAAAIVAGSEQGVHGEQIHGVCYTDIGIIYRQPPQCRKASGARGSPASAVLDCHFRARAAGAQGQLVASARRVQAARRWEVKAPFEVYSPASPGGHGAGRGPLGLFVFQALLSAAHSSPSGCVRPAAGAQQRLQRG